MKLTKTQRDELESLRNQIIYMRKNIDWRISFYQDSELKGITYTAPSILDAIQQHVEQGYLIHDVCNILKMD